MLSQVIAKARSRDEKLKAAKEKAVEPVSYTHLDVYKRQDERQEAMLRKQIDDLEMAIQSARYEQDGGLSLIHI